MSPLASAAGALETGALSSDDWRLLVESVEDYAIFMLDESGRVMTWNLGAQKIVGYLPGEIAGSHFSRFYPPNDVEAGKPEHELMEAREIGRLEDEGWRIRKDDSRFWANVVITALHRPDGALRGFAMIIRDLTQRRKAEEQLRKAEERFHHLVRAVSDYAIFMLDEDGLVSSWNAGAEKTKGYAAHEIIGKHFSIFYAPEDRAAGKPARLLETVRREGRCEDEGWRVRKDGTRFWANVVITPLRDDDGNLIGFAKVTRDLTQRRENEEVQRRLAREQAARSAAEESERQLAESEERYRALSQRLEVILEGVADGITVQDRSGRLVFANSAAARLCGLDSVGELLNTPPATLFRRFETLDERGLPFDPNRLPGRRILRGEEPGSVTLHIRERATGRDWWSLIRASPVLGADGKPELVVNILHEATIARRNEQRSKHLTEATAAMSVSLDAEQMLSTLANGLVPELGDWCAIHLRDKDQLRNIAVGHADPDRAEIAKRLAPPQPLEPADCQQRGLWSVVESGKSELLSEASDALLEQIVPRAARRAEGAAKSALLVPILNRDHVLGTLALASTETARRYDDDAVMLLEEIGRRAGAALENAQLYRDAQEAAARAEAASRVKDEFLATVSHELRTPLNAIVGWASLLRERSLDPELAKAIEIIDRNAQAQVKIIDDILDVSRIIAGKLRLEPLPMDLTRIAREALEVVRPAAEAKSIALDFRAPGKACVVLGDPERLQQVAWNLLSNAVKFSDSGGVIRLAIESTESHVLLRVSDDGRGIEPDFLPFVFDRFRQADASTTRRIGGLGLGLALVRHIVELHGGTVAAESPGPGKGSTFTIALPRREAAPIASADRPQARSSGSLDRVLEGLRVLIVDDERDARQLLAEVLAQAGAVVETAASAATGFQALQRFHPHVLVSDIAMPEEDGYSFMQRVRAASAPETASIPALALTAYTRNEDRVKALSKGFTTHIGKPVNPRDLVTAVASLASGNRLGA